MALQKKDAPMIINGFFKKTLLETRDVLEMPWADEGDPSRPKIITYNQASFLALGGWG
jgi:hypothetical protein